MKTSYKRYLVFSAFIMGFLFLPFTSNGWEKGKDKIKVACIGDSITFGARLENPEVKKKFNKNSFY